MNYMEQTLQSCAFEELTEREMMDVNGGLAVAVLGAMGTIYGAVEASKWAYNHGKNLAQRYNNWKNSR